MSLSNSLRAFLTVEWLHCSGGRSSSLGQLWRERGDIWGVWGVEGDREHKIGKGRTGRKGCREGEGRA